MYLFIKYGDVVWMLYGCCMDVVWMLYDVVCDKSQRLQQRPAKPRTAPRNPGRAGWMADGGVGFGFPGRARLLAARDGGMGCSFPCHAGWLVSRSSGVGFGIPCRAGSFAARNGGVGFDLGWAGLGRAGLGWLALAWPGPRQGTDRDPTASQNVTKRLAGTRKRTQRAGRN